MQCGFTRHFQLNALTEEDLRRAAEEEFGTRATALLPSSIQSIRDWLSKSPHLSSIRQDDVIIKFFLRGCKYSIERCKEKMDMFHAIKASTPEWFDNWDPFDPRIQELLGRGVVLPLPGYDKEGRFVVMVRSGRIRPSKVGIDDVIKASNIVMATAIDGKEQVSVKGFVMINNLEGDDGPRPVLSDDNI